MKVPLPYYLSLQIFPRRKLLVRIVIGHKSYSWRSAHKKSVYDCVYKYRQMRIQAYKYTV